MKRDGTAKPDVELSASSLRLSSGPSDVDSPVRALYHGGRGTGGGASRSSDALLDPIL